MRYTCGMSSKIKVLDEITINKIAAGEVIENPSSVVKELVENSIDAGSTDICVEIKGGGRQLIRISDNGCGMNKDDALLCLERHATSKLREIDDIHSLETMGFRGEAMPSIASISKFMILTSASDAEEGTMVIVDGGHILTCGGAVRTKGTTIEVKSLFFNVPARKKFQRSPNYDANEILKVITDQALAHPHIKFTLTHNQENILAANQGELKGRITDILGAEFFSGLCPISYEKEEFKVEGYIGLPSFTRHNRTGQHLFINQRAVYSPQVNYAIKDGYGTSLGSNRHPVYVLHLTVPGSAVDVNVHPQKKEVRLRQDLTIKEFISEAIDKALEGTRVTFSAPELEIPKIVPAFSFQQTYIPPQPVVPVMKVEQKPPELFPVEEKKEVPRVITTIKGYLLLDSANHGLKLMDQRAAHSRVIFERLLKTAAPIEIQTLLIPYTLNVTPVEKEILRDNLPILHSLGIQIEEFGQNSFIVQGVPNIFTSNDIQELVREILSALQENQGPQVARLEKEKVIALAASRASIPKKAQLSPMEGQALVNQLMKCEKPMHCPLGRPTMIEISPEDIVKQFQK